MGISRFPKSKYDENGRPIKNKFFSFNQSNNYEKNKNILNNKKDDFYIPEELKEQTLKIKRMHLKQEEKFNSNPENFENGMTKENFKLDKNLLGFSILRINIIILIIVLLLVFSKIF